MKRLVLVILALVILAAPAYARYAKRNNLYRLVNNRILKVYLGDFTSVTDKISPEDLKETVKQALLARRSEIFEIMPSTEEAEVIINGDIVSYRYLDKDPVDQVVAGASGLLVDAAIDQNYVQIIIDFTVISVKHNKRLWHKKFPVSITRTDMPEADSIPLVLNGAAKRFIFYCFNKPKG